MSKLQEGMNDPLAWWIGISGIIMILALAGVLIYVFVALNSPSCIAGTNGC